VNGGWPRPLSARRAGQPRQCHLMAPSPSESPPLRAARTALLRVSERAGQPRRCSELQAVLTEPAGAPRAWHERGRTRMVLILTVPRAQAHFSFLQKPSSAQHRLPQMAQGHLRNMCGSGADCSCRPRSHFTHKVGTKNTLLKAILRECVSESLLPHHPVGYMGLSGYKVLPPPV